MSTAPESPPLEEVDAREAPLRDSGRDPDRDPDLRDSDPPSSQATPFTWKTNLVLFLATLLSVFYTGVLYANARPESGGLVPWLRALPQGWTFAVPLLGILLFHEFGHYFAARYHRVDASLPYFLPVPYISPFGTMGAVISMRGRIKSRSALLDIGASGPLAGLVVAIPVLALGLSQSPFIFIGDEAHGSLEGQSLLYIAMKRVVLGPIPEGYDVLLSPVAFAGWTGLFVTALNLIPIGQLDGGHIAYALFGPKQNRYARALHWGLLGMFAYNLAVFMIPVVQRRAWSEVDQAIMNSLCWLVWFVLLRALRRVSGRDHPPTEPGELSTWRKGIAVLSLALFVLLFMPTPWTTY